MITPKPSLFYQPKMSIANAAEFLGVSIQAVHKQLKAKDLVCPKIGNKSYITHKIARQLFDLKFSPKKIAVQIVKGGTGKTTSFENIASCANVYGARILKIDLDPQGNATDSNDVDPEEIPVLIDVLKGGVDIHDCIVPICEGMDLIPSRIENVILDNEIVNNKLRLDKMFKNILKPIEKNYDFIFIDCPPTLGESVAAASLYSDIILAPLNPDKYSAKGLKILKKEIETLSKNFEKKLDYRVFLNKFSGKTILSDKAIMSLISDPELDGKVLSTTIQFSQEIPNITDESKNIFTVLKKSSVRDDYDRLTKELLDITSIQTNQVNKHSLSGAGE